MDRNRELNRSDVLFSVSKSKLFFNQPDKTLFDFGVARNRGSASGQGVGVDIVPFAVALQMATTFDK